MPQVKAHEQTAALVQVLEYMDGPQAVLLRRSDDRKIVSVAIDSAEAKCPFFGAEISFDQWERYRRGFVDLRYLFTFPRWKAWYLFDLSELKDNSVVITRTKMDSYAEEHYLPDAQFFAYDHSEPIKSTETESLATQQYLTDGVWDLPDFTEFYRKITDLYVFYLSLDKFNSNDTPVDQKRRIRLSFSGHPLRGGSSYVNLYGDLASTQMLGERLSVGKLKYASAGEVDVRGRLDIFSEMSASLGGFSEDYLAIKDVYNRLHSYLSKGKFLSKQGSDRFDPDGPVAARVLEEAEKLSAALKIEQSALIYDLTGRHSLKYAKIMLAHFRRLESYFMFFAEGRVKEPENIAPQA
ncbi:MAG TPA: hypothetical protein VHU23_11595 [Rhizomicrobium sp.]|jgi:hypothetical protein|nr:hypothetical protein [Rhizomicrobium sp.]